MENRAIKIKVTVVFFMLFIISICNANAIGFPHGYTKKKKTEQSQTVKKLNSFEKKIILISSIVAGTIEKYFEIKGQ